MEKQIKPWTFEEFINKQDISGLSPQEQEEWTKNPDSGKTLYSLYKENFYKELLTLRESYSAFIEDYYYTNSENKQIVAAGEKAPNFEDWVQTQKKSSQ